MHARRDRQTARQPSTMKNILLIQNLARISNIYFIPLSSTPSLPLPALIPRASLHSTQGGPRHIWFHSHANHQTRPDHTETVIISSYTSVLYKSSYSVHHLRLTKSHHVWRRRRVLGKVLSIIQLKKFLLCACVCVYVGGSLLNLWLHAIILLIYESW